MVSFTPWPLYSGERAPGAHSILDWVGCRVGMGAVKQSENSCFCRESNRDRQARSPLLYRLNYPGSHDKNLFVTAKVQKTPLLHDATVGCFRRQPHLRMQRQCPGKLQVLLAPDVVPDQGPNPGLVETTASCQERLQQFLKKALVVTDLRNKEFKRLRERKGETSRWGNVRAGRWVTQF